MLTHAKHYITKINSILIWSVSRSYCWNFKWGEARILTLAIPRVNECIFSSYSKKLELWQWKQDWGQWICPLKREKTVQKNTYAYNENSKWEEQHLCCKSPLNSAVLWVFFLMTVWGIQIFVSIKKMSLKYWPKNLSCRKYITIFFGSRLGT